MNFKELIIKLGNFEPLPEPLVEFMGLDNTVFLIGIMSHYNHLSKKKQIEEEKKLYYSAGLFEKRWGISRHRQKKVIKELKKCYLLTEIDRTSKNCRKFVINFIRCCCLAQLVYAIQKNPHLWPGLTFAKLQKDETVRKLLWRLFKVMRAKWDEVCYGDTGKDGIRYENFKQLLLKTVSNQQGIVLAKTNTANKDGGGRQSFFRSCAIKLYQAVSSHQKVMRKVNMDEWAGQFRKLYNYIAGKDRVRKDKIENVLNWYIANFGSKYVPEVYSAEAFRNKFPNIEYAKERKEREEGEDVLDDTWKDENDDESWE